MLAQSEVTRLHWHSACLLLKTFNLNNFQTLLRNDAVVDAADYDGMTPLHFASRRRGGEGCVAILLNAGIYSSYMAFYDA